MNVPYSGICNRVIDLPQVTLCAVTSVNAHATLRSIEFSLSKANFAECKIFTDCDVVTKNESIEVIKISKLLSSEEYSEFILNDMEKHIKTSHCMIVQWDGHILDAGRWSPDFLEYDYIGASWPQFQDGKDVGNGGFSLRSRRLMRACRDENFHRVHPEDVAIGRVNRKWLEEKGMRFAPRALADLFSTERAGDLRSSFGYHGAWNMPRAIGADAFWEIYQKLDDRSTVSHDLRVILKDVMREPHGLTRAGWMIFDHWQRKLQRR